MSFSGLYIAHSPPWLYNLHIEVIYFEYYN
jgi:hypothetical protein